MGSPRRLDESDHRAGVGGPHWTIRSLMTDIMTRPSASTRSLETQSLASGSGSDRIAFGSSIVVGGRSDSERV